MITRHALTVEPLLVGPIRQHRHPDRFRRPGLVVAAWCSYCRDHHHVSMPDEMDPETVVTVEDPRPAGPLAGRPVAVGADPAHLAEARRVLVGFRASLRRWRSEQKFRELAAESRALERARMRGGGRAVFSVDLRDAEGRYVLEPSHGWTAERLYDRRWALTILDLALGRLSVEMHAAGKAPSSTASRRPCRASARRPHTPPSPPGTG
jgi:hypothetical protein